jgi:DNA-binding XRE family transcriptional regulator
MDKRKANKKETDFVIDPNKVRPVILRYRNESNLSQERFALDANIGRKTMTNLETGVSVPNLSTLFKMGKLLKIRPSEILRAIEDNLDEEDQFWLEDKDE